MKLKFEWERIGSEEETFRAKVPGGWMVMAISLRWSTELMVADSVSESSVFIPDPNHEWEVE